MLSNIHKLYFPKLIFIKSVISKKINEDDSQKPLNLYTLDWSRKESKCSQGCTELNDFYESLLRAFSFAISDGYLKEIHRVSWVAPSEWNSLRLIDPSLKHIYLKPAAAYIEVGFRLIADSAYDEALELYYRGGFKKVLPYILLYKYWKNQVNDNLLFNFSKISELVTLSMNSELTDEESVEINEFLNYVNNELEVPSGTGRN
jgi:hypothetical protein